MEDSGTPLGTSPSLKMRLEDLRGIEKLSDPTVRNLLITQRYHDLSHDLARVLGNANANWSTFATWASKTAGQSIREQEVPEEFTRFLQTEARLEARLQHFRRALGPFARFAPRLDAFDLARAIIKEVASQIAAGNLRVYAELAPLFAEFAEAFADEATRRPDALERFLTNLSKGSADEGGQALLDAAFRSYFTASLLVDEAAQAELILLGNLMIGLHEQTRLQDHIAGALDAPFSAAIYERFGALGPKFLHRPLRAALRAGVKFFASELLDDWQRLATRLLMKLGAPNGEDIPLGRDLAPERFDPLLARLVNQDLIAFLRRYDKNLDSTRGSAAVNWTILEDRMRFIGELFRVSQRDASWFDRPFKPEQQREIEDRRVPAGPL